MECVLKLFGYLIYYDSFVAQYCSFVFAAGERPIDRVLTGFTDIVVAKLLYIDIMNL